MFNTITRANPGRVASILLSLLIIVIDVFGSLCVVVIRSRAREGQTEVSWLGARKLLRQINK